MQVNENFSRVVNRRRYSVKTATLLASDAYWDGHNWERRGRNTFLYRTSKDAFFVVSLTQWQGEQDTLEPVTEGDAIELFEGALSEHDLSYQDAFPNVTVEDA